MSICTKFITFLFKTIYCFLTIHYESVIYLLPIINQIAILPWNSVKIRTECARNGFKYKTIVTEVIRIKTESVHPGTDKCVHYAHATEIKRCYLFSMLYALVMNDAVDPSMEMFPTWKKQVKFTKKGTESQVSQKFAKYMTTMIGIAQDYLESYKGIKDLNLDESQATKLVRNVYS